MVSQSLILEKVRKIRNLSSFRIWALISGYATGTRIGSLRFRWHEQNRCAEWIVLLYQSISGFFRLFQNIRNQNYIDPDKITEEIFPSPY